MDFLFTLIDPVLLLVMARLGGRTVGREASLFCAAMVESMTSTLQMDSLLIEGNLIE